MKAAEILLLTCWAFLGAQDQDIDSLVKSLSSKDPSVAAQAEASLVDLGSKAIPPLEKAEKDAAPELRDRLRRVLQEIRDFDAGLESWEASSHVELLKKLDKRAAILQRRFGRTSGKPARVMAVLEKEHGDKLGAKNSYDLAAYSFEFETREDVQRVKNDWDFLFTDGRFRVRTVSDDRSDVWDLGACDFDKPAFDKPEAGKTDDLKAAKGRVYIIHTDDSDSDYWIKMQVVEQRPAQWILLRWERIPVSGALLSLQRRPERHLKSGQVRIQIRAGHAGKDPMRLHMDGARGAHLEQVKDKPLDMEAKPGNHDSEGYFQGGLIPMGKVWIVRRAQVKATCHEEGTFQLSAKGHIVSSSKHEAQILKDTWTGRIVVRPGEERLVFAEVSYFTRCDVTISGLLCDERFADVESFPELQGAEKEKADALLKSLDSDDAAARERAIRDLVEWGPPVLGFLQGVDASRRSGEFKDRLKDVIRRISGE